MYSLLKKPAVQWIMLNKQRKSAMIKNIAEICSSKSIHLTLPLSLANRCQMTNIIALNQYLTIFPHKIQDYQVGAHVFKVRGKVGASLMGPHLLLFKNRKKWVY